PVVAGPGEKNRPGKAHRRWHAAYAVGWSPSRAQSFRQPLERLRHDLREACRGRQGWELLRIEPARLVELLAEDRLAGRPAGGKAQDEEMALHPPLAAAHAPPPGPRQPRPPHPPS